MCTSNRYTHSTKIITPIKSYTVQIRQWHNTHTTGTTDKPNNYDRTSIYCIQNKKTSSSKLKATTVYTFLSTLSQKQQTHPIYKENPPPQLLLYTTLQNHFTQQKHAVLRSMVNRLLKYLKSNLIIIPKSTQLNKLFKQMIMTPNSLKL